MRAGAGGSEMVGTGTTISGVGMPRGHQAGAGIVMLRPPAGAGAAVG